MELYPSARTVAIGIDELQKLGLVEAGEPGVFRLSGSVDKLSHELDCIGEQWQGGVQNIFGAAVSDWELLSRVDCSYQTHFQSSLAAKFEQLAEMYYRGKRSPETLDLMADLGSPRIAACIDHALRGPASGTLSAALDIVENLGWAESQKSALLSLVYRIDPNGGLPAPHIWVRVAKLLASLGGEIDAIENKLEAIHSSSLSGATFLAMELNLPCALRLVRRSLRSHIPVNRIEVAAALAVIDLPWCRRELIRVLEQTADQEMTTECRSALCESRDTRAHDIAKQWEIRHPHSPQSDPLPTFGELSKLRNDESFQHEMQSLHDRVIPLRATFTPAE